MKNRALGVTGGIEPIHGFSRQALGKGYRPAGCLNAMYLIAIAGPAFIWSYFVDEFKHRKMTPGERKEMDLTKFGHNCIAHD